MPQITPNQAETTTTEPPRKTSPQPSPSSPPATGPDNPAPKRGEKGAMFRALVKAGCDAPAAYNAEAEVGSMAAENVVAQLGAQFQLGFMELRQLCRENAEGLVEQGKKLEALTEAGIERDRKLDVLAAEVNGLRGVLTAEVTGLKEVLTAEVTGLKEVLTAEVTGLKEVLTAEVTGLKEISAARTDALKMEFRLAWGALGVLVTVLLAVFGFLFTR